MFLTKIDGFTKRDKIGLAIILILSAIGLIASLSWHPTQEKTKKPNESTRPDVISMVKSATG